MQVLLAFPEIAALLCKKQSTMKNNLIICLFCCCFSVVSAQLSPEQKRDSLLHLLQSHLSHQGKKPVHNFMLYAESGQDGFVFNEGVGIVGRNENPIDADFQFNIASITKTFVAVVILQLWEEGKLDLQDKAMNHLRTYPYLDMENILLMDGKPYGQDITVEHLLRHTSGLGDFFIDTQTRFYLSVLMHKKRHYTLERMSKIYFKYNLHKKPHSLPGKGYFYSDMNYVLLGHIVQEVTGSTLHEQIRQRIIEPLKMDNTYFIYYEPATGHGKRIDAYLNRLNLTKKVNTSYEWGGGGLVSTNAELATFIKALYGLQLFQNQATLEAMTDFSVTAELGGQYGYGLSEYTLDDEKYYGHGGFYGSLLLHQPEEGITISANVGQANTPFNAAEFVKKILRIMRVPSVCD